MSSNTAYPTLTALKGEVQCKIGTLLLSDLKIACSKEGLSKTGRKLELQSRLLSRLNYLNDQESVARLLQSLGGSNLLIQHSSSSPYTSPAELSHRWRESPFYKIKKILATNRLIVCQSHRNSVSTTINWHAQDLEDIRTNSHLRVLLFCGERPNVPGSVVDVGFPIQIELKVNGHDVKANLRGIKKKPGSTNPVDITGFVRTRSHLPLPKVDITYACTDKIFDVAIVMAKRFDVDELVTQVKDRRVISKEQVLHEMRSNADDDDIVAGPTIMSLKDSVSYARISVPCRGMQCTHYSCFDLYSYLEMQKQAPLWTCPICDKKVSFTQIVMDKYFDEILLKTPSKVESVTVQPDGTWSADAPTTKRKRGDDSDSEDDSDDDLVEISPPKKKNEGLQQSASATPGVGSKRQSNVIDLTLSSDDEGPRQRATTSMTQSPLANRSASQASMSSTTAQPSQPRIGLSHAMSNSAPLERFSFQLNPPTATSFAPHSHLPQQFFSVSPPFPRMLPSPSTSPSPYPRNPVGSNMQRFPLFGRPSLGSWTPGSGSNMTGSSASPGTNTQ